ncbi:hypothetical protein Tco_1212483 [Tanacetum coccineum]
MPALLLHSQPIISPRHIDPPINSSSRILESRVLTACHLLIPSASTWQAVIGQPSPRVSKWDPPDASLLTSAGQRSMGRWSTGRVGLPRGIHVWATWHPRVGHMASDVALGQMIYLRAYPCSTLKDKEYEADEDFNQGSHSI